eukprot:11209172-Alexandrium_andersonii.AAC.1
MANTPGAEDEAMGPRLSAHVGVRVCRRDLDFEREERNLVLVGLCDEVQRGHAASAQLYSPMRHCRRQSLAVKTWAGERGGQ